MKWVGKGQLGGAVEGPPAPRAGGTKMVRCVDGMGSLPRTLTWFQIAN